MEHIESIQIYLNSRYATEVVNGNIANCIYYLPVIEIPDGHHIYLSLQNATIPYSFYSITSFDNTFIFGLVFAIAVFRVGVGNPGILIHTVVLSHLSLIRLTVIAICHILALLLFGLASFRQSNRYSLFARFSQGSLCGAFGIYTSVQCAALELAHDLGHFLVGLSWFLHIIYLSAHTRRAHSSTRWPDKECPYFLARAPRLNYTLNRVWRVPHPSHGCGQRQPICPPYTLLRQIFLPYKWRRRNSGWR